MSARKNFAEPPAILTKTSLLMVFSAEEPLNQEGLESLAQKTTLAPFLAKRREVEYPMPSLPPVTIATLPLKSWERKEETETSNRQYMRGMKFAIF